MRKATRCSIKFSIDWILEAVVGLNSTVGHTEPEACGQNNLHLGEETPLSRLAG